MDKNRRKFIKILLIGSASFMAGKVLGPLISKFSDNSSAKSNSTAFKVVENNKSFSVYDGSGEEIFQIDKGA